MLALPDVNVLVAAFRQDHSHHTPAATWLAAQVAAANRQTLVSLSAMAGFLRLVTNRKVFPKASSTKQAVEFADWLVAQPNTRLHANEKDWSQLRGLVLAHSLSANAVPDAWLAAECLTTGATLVTFDTGFKRLLPARQLKLLAA